jgi:CRISPR system Cascade subunit CasD
LRSDGSGTQDTVLSSRYYLADADFLIGLEGERTLLETIDAALRAPTWQLSLGRKSFVPGLPIALPLQDKPLREVTLIEALSQFPLRTRKGSQPSQVRTVVEIPFSEEGEPRRDQPVHFEKREYALRNVRQGFLPDFYLNIGLPPIEWEIEDVPESPIA